MRLFNITTLSEILQINNTAIMQLVNMGKIPYKIIRYNNNELIQFEPAEIKKWIPQGAVMPMTDEEYIAKFKKEIDKKYAEELKMLKEYGSQFTGPQVPKRYYLERVPNKKLGFVYYVKYLHNGKLIPSKWNLRTNNRDIAEKLAVENREKLIAGYLERKTVKNPYTNLYLVLKKYYTENSPYLQIEKNKGRGIGEEARTVYHNFIVNQFIPYLKKHKIKEIEEIDTPFLSRFRNYLMTDRVVKGKVIPGVKPQTTKHKVSYISKIFDHLLEEGYIKINPCKNLRAIKVKKDDIKVTGCYNTDRLKGVFNKRWENQLSYLLSMIMYTTNMRNREIERMQLKDLIAINNINFINIPESKSVNGERAVPLHPFARRKILAYAKKNNKIEGEDYIFRSGAKKLCSRVYSRAYAEMGKRLGYTKEMLKEENIKFYSGRHFWKTLMNGEGLGDDIEEVFMGHKVTGDVKERYNHRNKQGEKKMLEKARKVLNILDKKIFR